MTLQEWKAKVKGTTASVLGIGVSNLPLIRFLRENGVHVIAHDRQSAEQLQSYEELKQLGVELILGEDYLKEIPQAVSVVYKTPGIRKDVPALLAASARGVEITSEMELFFKLCPAKKIAVTGSDGKTTTTTLIYEILQKQGYRCFLGGNIGRPLILDLEGMNEEDFAVVELSSFQLHTMHQSPEVAVVTNVTPNHLDWHTDYQEYIDSKKAVFAYQKPGDKAVLNYDNDITRAFAKDAGTPVFFSRQSKIEDGYCLEDGEIVFRRGGKTVRSILPIADIRIPGMHNVENYMAAIAATDGLADDTTVRQVAKEFPGVPHRIEFVRELEGVRYYNDSIASSPARTTAGLKSFGGKKVILIAGGYDKKIPFDEFGAVVNDFVKKLVLVGVTSDKIEAAVKQAKNFKDLPIYRHSDFAEAVACARKIADPEDIVLLSPACASFDLFKNFEVRGNTFKDIVNKF